MWDYNFVHQRLWRVRKERDNPYKVEYVSWRKLQEALYDGSIKVGFEDGIKTGKDGKTRPIKIEFYYKVKKED